MDEVFLLLIILHNIIVIYFLSLECLLKKKISSLSSLMTKIFIKKSETSKATTIYDETDLSKIKIL